MIIDPSEVANLVGHLQGMDNILEVSMLECDADQGCAVASGFKAGDGDFWHVRGGLPNAGADRTVKLLSATDCFTE